MKKRFVFALMVVVMCAFPLVAQSDRSGPDTLSALLVEVRALRVAMERAASTTPQIQLLAARLTVQNERLARVSRDADAAHQDLERVQSQGATFAARAAQLEEAVARETDPARLRDLKSEQSGVKAQIDELALLESRFRARDAELANQVAAEQGQWIEVKRRFDELERELAGRRPQ
jgi:predicted  nucleic acid-binding Zn-ribbon protein